MNSTHQQRPIAMYRRRFLKTCAAALAGNALAASTAFGRDRLFTPASRGVPGIIDIGSTRQPFLDDLLVFQASKIRPVLTHPQPAASAVIVGDRPWESGGHVQLNGPAVLYDEDDAKFKMWYGTRGLPDRRRPWCYAESSDGYTWEKPELGIHEVNGSKKNNIVAFWTDPSFSTVFKDPHDPDPQRRFKAHPAALR